MADVHRRTIKRKAMLWDEYRWRYVSAELPEDGKVLLIANRPLQENMPWGFGLGSHIDGAFRDMVTGLSVEPDCWKYIYTPVEAMG